MASKRRWFVDPTATVRIVLDEDDGFWIEVKKELSLSEETALASAMVGDMTLTGGGKSGKGQPAKGAMPIDMRKYQIERFATWIVDWSGTDDKGKRVPLSRDAIANLTSDVGTLIDEALDAHIEAIEAGKESKGGETPV